MKISYHAAFGVLSALLVPSAQAQSSLSIYGVLDAGVTYLSNSGGHSRTSLDSSPSKPSRLGIRGSEDLGEGLSAIINLEAGILTDTGTQFDANTFWNREASVGLTSRTWGTIKAGRMPDLSYTDLGILDGTPMIEGGMQSGYTGFSRPAGQAGAPPPVDLHYGGARYNNAIKWYNQFGAVRAGLMYAMGSENRTDKMYGAMLRYSSNGFAIGAAYTKDNFTKAVFAREALVIKTQYDSGPFIFAANYGVGKDDTTQAQNRPLELTVVYAPDVHWRVGGGFGYAWATNTTGQKARLQQPFVGAKYLISARTELYAMAAHVKSSNAAAVPASFGPSGGALEVSSSNSMSGIRFGLLHNF
ncbi:porin [Diaphorobacter sp. HDW4A]|uniref:porin n=1 Tax=Diaphorobacter sp. HDW4A TaxID=2714924 RepID=UPI00140A263D|nr:porin [Diaphorobacter sp. HDW4A]QIL79415.1 porin [Diaphorobacter sp. HDW4A]